MSLVTGTRSLAALAAALVVGVLPAAAGSATRADDRPEPAPPVHRAADVRTLDSAGQASGRDPFARSRKIVGANGKTYDTAPFVVPGLGGELFLGPDFDVACALGKRYVRAMKTYAKVAELIRESGRTVVFTAAPNKSSVFPNRLDLATLPHGPCDSKGIAAQTRVLKRFGDPDYLSLVEPLRATLHQAYWKTDPHWTSVGGSVFAKQLAHHLDPRLAKRQRYTYGTEVGLGMLAAHLGSEETETLETAFPNTGVKVKTGKGCADWAGYPTLIFDTCWASKPAKRTWPGRTLLLGDSFMMYALENLRPMFQQGTFMWLGHADRDVAKAVRHSDTVVIEVAQLFVPGTIIATQSFRKALRRELL